MSQSGNGFFQDITFCVHQYNNEVAERVEEAKEFGYSPEHGSDEIGDGEEIQRRIRKSQNRYREYCLILYKNNIDPEKWNLYETLCFIEDIQCNQLKDSIFEGLAYVKNESAKKQIKKDTIGSNYSTALYEISKEVSRLIKAQDKK